MKYEHKIEKKVKQTKHGTAKRYLVLGCCNHPGSQQPAKDLLPFCYYVITRFDAKRLIIKNDKPFNLCLGKSHKCNGILILKLTPNYGIQVNIPTVCWPWCRQLRLTGRLIPGPAI